MPDFHYYQQNPDENTEAKNDAAGKIIQSLIEKLSKGTGPQISNAYTWEGNKPLAYSTAMYLALHGLGNAANNAMMNKGNTQPVIQPVSESVPESISEPVLQGGPGAANRYTDPNIGIANQMRSNVKLASKADAMLEKMREDLLNKGMPEWQRNQRAKNNAESFQTVREQFIKDKTLDKDIFDGSPDPARRSRILSKVNQVKTREDTLNMLNDMLKEENPIPHHILDNVQKSVREVKNTGDITQELLDKLREDYNRSDLFRKQTLLGNTTMSGLGTSPLRNADEIMKANTLLDSLIKKLDQRRLP